METQDFLVIDNDKIEVRTFKPELAEFQGIVGGYIEFVQLTGGAGMFINDSGKLDQLPRNILAEWFINEVCRLELADDEWIAGPVVVVGPPDDEGDTLGTPEAILSATRATGVLK